MLLVVKCIICLTVTLPVIMYFILKGTIAIKFIYIYK